MPLSKNDLKRLKNVQYMHVNQKKFRYVVAKKEGGYVLRIACICPSFKYDCFPLEYEPDENEIAQIITENF